MAEAAHTVLCASIPSIAAAISSRLSSLWVSSGAVGGCRRDGTARGLRRATQDRCGRRGRGRQRWQHRARLHAAIGLAAAARLPRHLAAGSAAAAALQRRPLGRATLRRGQAQADKAGRGCPVGPGMQAATTEVLGQLPVP